MTAQGVTLTMHRSPATPVVVTGGWEKRYRRTLALLDGSGALAAATIGYLGRLGADRAVWNDVAYVAVAAAAPLLWVALLSLARGYDAAPLSDGWYDARQVLTAGAVVLGLV